MRCTRSGISSFFPLKFANVHLSILSKAIERYVQNMGFSVEEFQKEFRAESAAQESWRQGHDIIRRGEMNDLELIKLVGH